MGDVMGGGRVESDDDDDDDERYQKYPVAGSTQGGKFMGFILLHVDIVNVIISMV